VIIRARREEAVLTTHLDRTTARAAIALANRAPSVHNAQPWRWRIGPSSIHLFADRGRALPATDPEGRDLRLGCGAALHHLRTALRGAGFATDVHRLPDPAHPDHLAAVEPYPAAPTAEDLALANAIERRRSDRRVYSTWPVPGVLLDELADAARHEGAQLRVLAHGFERRTVVELVERAAVEQALAPGMAQEIAAWTGRVRGAAEGIAAANVPEAPAGTVPVRHTSAAEQRENELGPGERDGTVLALLATATDRPIDQLRAGVALSAVLLTATRIGVASDPISQPLEVPGTRDALRLLCPDEAREPQLILRLGWAPPSAAPVPASGRRPVDETIDRWDEPWP
jgi:nitroreductase